MQETLSIENLLSDVEELKKELKLKDWRLNLILDHLPVLFFYCDKDGIFEVLQGDGMSKVLMQHDPSTLYDLFNDFPAMFARADANKAGHYRDKIPISLDLALGIEYQLTKTVVGKISGMVGFVNAFSRKIKAMDEKDLTALNENPDRDRLLELLESDNNKLDFGLIKESLRSVLESELQVKMSKILINKTKTKLAAN